MDSNLKLDATSAYARIREEILSGRRMPQERLVAQRLADELGISRTPVKEALARLEIEGLAVRVDAWGYVVRSISLRDADDLFEARLIIEVANARLAAERATEGEVLAMNKMLDASAKRLRKGDLAAFQSCARGVHERIAESTGNLQVIRMFKQLNDLVVLFGVSLLRLNPERSAEILAENTAIVGAIQERRREDAARLMHEHITRGHDSFRTAISSSRMSIPLD
ncbi:transcriptional regulator, GntR family [Piscinibacter sakaiensis]|uniref:Transcriptional regulator, GntR family n=2 Tax=Piscinibacter sakaiensis TaxID=1547922 RepID=A0A0K8NUQ4_PISS1|nr:transcriptional regulator, GntR family [Piscinibacter sakaiensis]